MRIMRRAGECEGKSMKGMKGVKGLKGGMGMTGKKCNVMESET